MCDEDSGGSWLPFSIFIFNKQNYILHTSFIFILNLKNNNDNNG